MNTDNAETTIGNNVQYAFCMQYNEVYSRSSLLIHPMIILAKCLEAIPQNYNIN